MTVAATTRLVAVLAALVSAGPLADAADAARDDTILVSRTPGLLGSVGAGDGSGRPASSADGRYVAFESSADDLAGGDPSVSNVFVRDVESGAVILVSRANGPAGAAADSTSQFPAISADGRYVAFTSGANNLLGDDDDTVTNVYLRDLQTGTTSLVSRATGGAAADGGSGSPSISADGRHVAFTSTADNLVDGENEAATNVFVRDTVAGTTTLVSRATGPAGAPADDGSLEPAISADGRVVAFESPATNLSDEDGALTSDVYVRDLLAQTTTLVSRGDGAAGAAGDGESYAAAISADGRVVAFESDAANLAGDDVDPVLDVFVRDLATGTTRLVSRASGPAGTPGDADSGKPTISADGRFVAFSSQAATLTEDDDAAFVHVFVRDTVAATTTLVSRASGVAGAVAELNTSSDEPSISATGRYVAFASGADVLAPDDLDGSPDVFRRDVLGPAPTSVTPPTIAGSGAVGAPLACDPGTWSDASATLAFQWARGGADIPGATAGAYVVAAGDPGQVLACRVTATTPAGSTSATSAGLLIVQTTTQVPAPPPPPAATPLGKLSAAAFAATVRARAVSLRFVVSVDARVQLSVARRTGTARIVATKAVTAGIRTIAWNRRLAGKAAAPGRYTLRITATAADGQVGTSTVHVVLPKPRQPRA